MVPSGRTYWWTSATFRLRESKYPTIWLRVQIGSGALGGVGCPLARTLANVQYVAELMDAFVDVQIRDRLADYVLGRQTLVEFENWFAPVAMEVEGSGNPAATSLAYLIELRLAEYTSGHWTESELNGLLSPHAFVSEVRTPGLLRTWTGSAAAAIRTQLAAALN